MVSEDGTAAGRAAGSAGHRADLVLPHQELNSGLQPQPRRLRAFRIVW